MKTLSCLVRRWVSLCLALGLVAGLSGCATTGPGSPADPLEGFNRAMFQFNDGVDTVALKPAATVYKTVLPSFVQTGVGNFFGNLADVWTCANNLLQGKLENSLTDMMRVAVNSTLGLGGLLDIGSEAGLPKHKEDFGQTLGKWGVGPGPYVVLPMFGPSTLRDSAALPVDLVGDPWSYAEPARTFNIGSVVRVVDLRAAALEAGDLVEDAALDRYVFIRDAYLQRRESKVYDGEVPPKTSSRPDAASAAGVAAVASVATPATGSESVAQDAAAALPTSTPLQDSAPAAVQVAKAGFKLDLAASPVGTPEAIRPSPETVQKPVPPVADKATRPSVSADAGEK
jgi:phospholipid-binding lipoprotein MlaA